MHEGLAESDKRSLLSVFEGSGFVEPEALLRAALESDVSGATGAKGEGGGPRQTLALVFATLMTVLLLNMLIAIMAKTFDTMYENKVGNYMRLTTLLVVTWEQASAVPPPPPAVPPPMYSQSIL